MRFPAFSLTVAGLVCLILLASHAECAAPTAEKISREYDIRDLIVDAPDFTDVPELKLHDQAADQKAAQERQAINQRNAPSRDALVKQLSDQFTARLTADEPAIELTEHEGKFSVGATAIQHQRIARLIDKMHADRSVQINCESRFLFFSKDDEKKMSAELAEKLWIARSKMNRSALTLTAEENDQLLKAVQSMVGGTQLTAPRITLFNGQEAYVVVSTEGDITASYDRFGAQWKPRTMTIATGTALDVRCTASADDSIAVEFRPQTSRLLNLRHEPFKGAPEAEHLMIDVPEVEKAKLNLLLNVHAGQTVLIPVELTRMLEAAEWPESGASSVDGKTGPATAASSVESSQRLYILFKASIIRKPFQTLAQPVDSNR